MSEKKKEKKPIHRTPVGVAVWPRLIEPDTKFNAEGVYSIKLRLSSEEAAPYVAEVDRLTAIELAALKKEVTGKKDKKGKPLVAKEADLPYSINDEEGTVELSFKLKAKGKDSKTGKEWEQKPGLFDAKGTPVKVNVWGGSKVKVAFEYVPFHNAKVGAGVSLRLKAVQIIELVTAGGGATSEYYGFEEEEGFTADDTADTSSDTEAAEGEDSQDEPEDF